MKSQKKIPIVFCLDPASQVECPFKAYTGEYREDTMELKPKKKTQVLSDDLDE